MSGGVLCSYDFIICQFLVWSIRRTGATMIASQPFVTRVAQAARPAALADNYLTAGTAIGNITPGHNPVNRSIRRLPCEHQQINIHPSFRLFLKRGKHRFWQSLSAIVVSNKIPIVQSRKRRAQVRQLEHFCPFGLSLAPNPPDPPAL